MGSTLSSPPGGTGTTSAPPAHSLEQALDALHRPFFYDPVNHSVLAEDEAPVNLRGLAYAPACPVENLGDPDFRADHSFRYAYAAGAMANGIGSVDIVEAMGRAGMVAFF